MECPEGSTLRMWVLYISLELLPLLLFYVVVVLLDVQAATPPNTSFVFFCQLFLQIFRSSAYVRMHFDIFANRQLRLFTLTVLDVWNLDFFRCLIPPFCVSSGITQIQSILLEYGVALTPLVLVAVTYIAIQLHARDVRIVVQAWRPFHRTCACFRRSCNPHASIVNAFTTFMLLSLSKITFLVFYTIGIMDLFFSEFPYKTDMNLYINPYKKLADVPGLAITLFSILFLFVLLPATLTILYPQKCLRRCCKCLYWSQSLWLFMEAFQGHYRGGTQGYCSFRFSAVLHFVNRVVISVVLVNLWFRVDPPVTKHLHIMSIYLVCVSLYYCIARPYSKAYMNNIEGFLYGLAAILTMDIVALSIDMHPRLVGNTEVHTDIVLVAMVMPSLALVGNVLFRLVVTGGALRRVGVVKGEESSSEGLPHRLHTENTPLVH